VSYRHHAGAWPAIRGNPVVGSGKAAPFPAGYQRGECAAGDAIPEALDDQSLVLADAD
jgi:hypothetical protein